MGQGKRLLEFHAYLKENGYGGRNKFEKEIGRSAGYLTNIGKTDANIGADVIKTLSAKFPQLNIDWLIGDAPNMIADTYTGNHLYTLLTYLGLSQLQFANKTEIDTITLYEVLDGRKPTEDIAKEIKAAFPQVNEEWIITGKGEMIIQEDNIQRELKKDNQEQLSQYFVPLLPTAAVGGNPQGIRVNGILPHECEQVLSPISNIDFAMPVCNDSMTPQYPNGSRVFIKKVNPSTFIEYNNIYVLDTENGAIIKKVMPSEKEGHIKCVSLNPEYLPFDVAIEDIYGWYKVLGCLTLNM